MTYDASLDELLQKVWDGQCVNQAEAQRLYSLPLEELGTLRDPVRNRWLFDFGLIACVLVIPYALIFGAARGIPFWWRLIDCSFGVFGFVPPWFCRTWAKEVEATAARWRWWGRSFG